MSLLNVVNITVDTLETTVGEIRGLEQLVVLDDMADPETRHHLSKQLAVTRRRLETITRELHEERRMATHRHSRTEKRGSVTMARKTAADKREHHDRLDAAYKLTFMRDLRAAKTFKESSSFATPSRTPSTRPRSAPSAP